MEIISPCAGSPHRWVCCRNPIASSGPAFRRAGDCPRCCLFARRHGGVRVHRSVDAPRHGVEFKRAEMRGEQERHGAWNQAGRDNPSDERVRSRLLRRTEALRPPPSGGAMRLYPIHFRSRMPGRCQAVRGCGGRAAASRRAPMRRAVSPRSGSGVRGPRWEARAMSALKRKGMSPSRAPVERSSVVSVR